MTTLLKDEIDQQILEIVKEISPENVKDLVEIVQKKGILSKKQAIQRIMLLQERGEINLKTDEIQMDNVDTRNYSWYWITVLISVTAAFIILVVHEENHRRSPQTRRRTK